MAQVLLVEDEPWLGELYCRLLGHAGHTVNWCRDGYDAINLIDAARPHVIVLDLLLPWANGLQLLHELASHADLGSIPVVLCSNVALQNVEPAILRHYGVVALIDKTETTPRRFVHVVQKALHANLSY